MTSLLAHVPSRPPRTIGDLLRSGALDIPLPGRGDTATRWSVLAGWGREDLVLARLAEGHTDACAILAEAGLKPVPDALYGVWAARGSGAGAELRGGAVHGTVPFCSGAHTLDRALVVAGDRAVEVDVHDARVHRVEGSWHPVGMQASDSVDVRFDGVPACTAVGPSGFYLERPGFWWGGAGVAAVWLGGAAGALDDLRAALREPHGHQLAHLGALHTAVAAADALLVAAAAAIDADPTTAHTTAVWTVRAAAEHAARVVLDLVPRVAGATVLSRHDRLGPRLADLGVYVRQHHGERDLAALGARVLDEDS